MRMFPSVLLFATSACVLSSCARLPSLEEEYPQSNTPPQEERIATRPAVEDSFNNLSDPEKIRFLHEYLPGKRFVNSQGKGEWGTFSPEGAIFIQASPTDAHPSGRVRGRWSASIYYLVVNETPYILQNIRTFKTSDGLMMDYCNGDHTILPTFLIGPSTGSTPENLQKILEERSKTSQSSPDPRC